MGSILRSEKVGARLRLKVLCAFIPPVVTWGAETRPRMKSTTRTRTRHLLEQEAATLSGGDKVRPHGDGRTSPKTKRVTTIQAGETTATAILRPCFPLPTTSKMGWPLLNAASATTNTKTRGKGGPRVRWMNGIPSELETKSLGVDDCSNGDNWQNIINNREKGARIDLIPNASDSVEGPPSIREVRGAQGRTREQ